MIMDSSTLLEFWHGQIFKVRVSVRDTLNKLIEDVISVFQVSDVLGKSQSQKLCELGVAVYQPTDFSPSTVD